MYREVMLISFIRIDDKKRKEMKKSKSRTRAARHAPTAGKPVPLSRFPTARRTSREIEDMFARLELLPTSSPLPARPIIRNEEEMAAGIAGWLCSPLPVDVGFTY
jgi:hypothetical protein